MSSLRTRDEFRSRLSQLVVGLGGLILAYVLGSRAFDTGSWWQYFGTLLILILSVRLIFRGVKAKK